MSNVVGSNDSETLNVLDGVTNAGDAIVAFNTTGVDGAEMEIVLANFTAGNLGAGDFVL